MHRGFFLPVKAFPPAPNGPGTGGGRCHATYLCGERFNSRPPWGGRQKTPCLWYTWGAFQSTLSVGRATLVGIDQSGHIEISIHALREEGDFHTERPAIGRHDFNPRPPRGGRRSSAVAYSMAGTPPQISIHALREESDMFLDEFDHIIKEFQSTPSARRATHSFCGM